MYVLFEKTQLGSISTFHAGYLQLNQLAFEAGQDAVVAKLPAEWQQQ